MAFAKIPSKKGVYITEDPHALVNSDYACEFVNLLLDDTGSQIDRPSLRPFVTLTSAIPIGATSFQNYLVVVTADRSVFAIDALGNQTNITGISLPGELRPVFAQDTENLYIIGGERPIFWAGVSKNTSGALVFSKTDFVPGSPPIGTHIVAVDGFLLVNDQDDATSGNTTFRWSAAGTDTRWDANSFAGADGDSDPIAALIVNHREVNILGTRSLEIWTNVGDLTTPFQRSFMLGYGTSAPYSPLVVDNSLIFLDQNRRVIRINGYSPQDIGGSVTKELEKYSTVSDCVTFHTEHYGKPLLYFIFPTVQKTWILDLSNGQWSEARGWQGFAFDRVRMNCGVYVPEWRRSFAGDFKSGKFFELKTDDLKYDDSDPLIRQRKFSFLDQGSSMRKRSNRVRFKIKRGVATALTGTVPEVTPLFEMRCRSDADDWQPWRAVALGAIGDTYNYVDFCRMGFYRTRQYEVRITDPVAFSLIDSEEDVEVLQR